VVLVRLRHVLVRCHHGNAGPRAARLRVRLVRLPLARHRRLSLDHHPGADLCAAARLLPQRHGLWRQQRPYRLQGHPRLQHPGAWNARGAVCCDVTVSYRLPSDAALDRHLSAGQGDGGRARCREPHAFSGIPGRACEALCLHAVRRHGGHCGCALRPAGRHHQSRRVFACQFDRDRDLDGGGRARHPGGPDPRRACRQFGQDLFHRRFPRYVAAGAWSAVRLRHAVPAARHRGHGIGLLARLPRRKREEGAPTPAAAPAVGAAE